MLTVMKTVLPDAVIQFLTPDAGEYDTVLLGGPQSRHPARPIPVEAWASLGQSARADTSFTKRHTQSVTAVLDPAIISPHQPLPLFCRVRFIAPIPRGATDCVLA